MFLEKAVPESARNAYRRDAWAGLLAGIYGGTIGPFLLFIARSQLHASESLIGLMAAGPFIGSMLALVYANSMEGRRKMPYVVWPLIIGRTLFVLTLFAVTPLPFALVVTAAQILGALIGPGYAVVMKEIYPDDQRGTIMSYIRIGIAAATFVTTLLVGPLLKGGHIPLLNIQVDPVSYKLIFPLGGLIGVASAIAFGSIKTAPVDPVHPDNQRVPIFHFLRDTLGILREDKGYLWFSLSIAIGGFGNLMVVPIYPLYQVDTLHITAVQVSILASITTIFWMFFYPYWGRYVDARCPIKASVINTLLVILVPLNYFMATNVWMLIPSAIILGISAGGTELAYFNSIMFFSKDGMEARYQALHSFLLGLRGTIAPFCGAALAAYFRTNGLGVRYIFLIAMVLLMVGCGLQAYSLRFSRGRV